MSEWKVINQKIEKLNGNNFIEVSLKIPPKGDDELIAISKGWIRDDGQRLYKANIIFAKSDKEKVIKMLEEIDSL